MSNDAQATSTRRPGRPKAGSEDKKARILAEALTLFSTRGYVATSLADIARASDISKAGLLHHYSSKDQLLAAVLEERDRRTLSRLPGVMRGRRLRSTRGWRWSRITSVILTGLPCTRRCRRRLSMLIIRPIRGSVSTCWGAISYLVDALERGKAMGEVRPGAPSEKIARKLVALSDGLQVQWLCSRADGGADVDMREVMAGMVADVKDRWLIRP